MRLVTDLNGTTITYDAIGNPLNWKNINSLNWSGRSLSGIYFDAAPYSGMDFRYNSAGIRTYKNYYNMITEVSNTSSYVLDGSNIIKETRTGSQAATLYYFYDESGVTGFNYNGTDYGVGYVNMAQYIGASFFRIADNIWYSMSPSEQWAANEAFLDNMISQGKSFLLTNNAWDTLKNFPNSNFGREIAYLLDKGYKIVENGFKMV